MFSRPRGPDLGLTAGRSCGDTPKRYPGSPRTRYPLRGTCTRHVVGMGGWGMCCSKKTSPYYSYNSKWMCLSKKALLYYSHIWGIILWDRRRTGSARVRNTVTFLLKFRPSARAPNLYNPCGLRQHCTEQYTFSEDVYYLVSRASKPSPVDGFHRAVDRGVPYRVSSWTMTYTVSPSGTARPPTMNTFAPNNSISMGKAGHHALEWEVCFSTCFNVLQAPSGTLGATVVGHLC